MTEVKIYEIRSIKKYRKSQYNFYKILKIFSIIKTEITSSPRDSGHEVSRSRQPQKLFGSESQNKIHFLVLIFVWAVSLAMHCRRRRPILLAGFWSNPHSHAPHKCIPRTIKYLITRN